MNLVFYQRIQVWFRSKYFYQRSKYTKYVVSIPYKGKETFYFDGGLAISAWIRSAIADRPLSTAKSGAWSKNKIIEYQLGVT